MPNQYRQTVVSRTAVDPTDTVTRHGYQLPRQWREVWSCGCESVATVVGTKVPVNQRLSVYMPAFLRDDDPMAYLRPKNRDCEIHRSTPTVSAQKAFYRRMSVALRARAKQRGLQYP